MKATKFYKKELETVGSLRSAHVQHLEDAAMYRILAQYRPLLGKGRRDIVYWNCDPVDGSTTPETYLDAAWLALWRAGRTRRRLAGHVLPE